MLNNGFKKKNEITSSVFASKPHVIVHYSAISTVNVSKSSLRLFELFTIKSVIKKIKKTSTYVDLP